MTNKLKTIYNACLPRCKRDPKSPGHPKVANGQFNANKTFLNSSNHLFLRSKAKKWLISNKSMSLNKLSLLKEIRSREHRLRIRCVIIRTSRMMSLFIEILLNIILVVGVVRIEAGLAVNSISMMLLQSHNKWLIPNRSRTYHLCSRTKLFRSRVGVLLWSSRISIEPI